MNELQKFDIETSGKVDTLRRRLVTFLRDGIKIDSDTPNQEGTDGKRQGSKPVTATESGALCDKVRKWGTSFDGTKDPVSFLERVGELQASYGLTESHMLRVLPELFKGRVLLWYRNNQSPWKTWQDFVHAFEVRYLPADYHDRLDDDIVSRVQGKRETVHDFVEAIQTLMRRRGGFTPKQMYERTYRNLRPEYKLYIKKEDAEDLEGIVRLGARYESVWEEEKRYGSKASQRDQAGNIDNSALGSKTREDPPKIHTTDLSPVESPTPGKAKERVHTKEIKCWNCSATGHMAHACPKPRVLKCGFCGREGVKATTCSCKESGNWRRDRKSRGHSGPPRQSRTYTTTEKNGKTG